MRRGKAPRGDGIAGNRYAWEKHRIAMAKRWKERRWNGVEKKWKSIELRGQCGEIRRIATEKQYQEEICLGNEWTRPALE